MFINHDQLCYLRSLNKTLRKLRIIGNLEIDITKPNNLSDLYKVSFKRYDPGEFITKEERLEAYLDILISGI